MKYTLRVLEGEDKGKSFTLSTGSRIGRARGEVILTDPKVSGKHALVETGENGKLWIVDQDSSNGTKVEGKEVERVELYDGLIIQFGRTICSLHLEQPELEEDTGQFDASFTFSPPVFSPPPAQPPTSPPLDPPAISSSPPPFTPPPEASVSSPTLPPVPAPEKPKPPVFVPPPVPEASLFMYRFIETALAGLTENPKSVAPFVPCVELRFIRGLQAETIWALGYGPRYIGIDSVDLPILDAQLKEGGFMLLPSPEGPTLLASSKTSIHVNGLESQKKILQSGDRILLGGVELEVKFLE